jgi:hypothetical protein
MALRSQVNRTFVVGLVGATIVSFGLFTLSRAGGEIRDWGGGELKTTSNCVAGRPQIAATFRSDREVTAFNLPIIQFDNRE